jgi:hypothetical protein
MALLDIAAISPAASFSDMTSINQRATGIEFGRPVFRTPSIRLAEMNIGMRRRREDGVAMAPMKKRRRFGRVTRF